ncbi:MAG: hypothetical protein FWC73_09810 [Defluviitaleaceae bacterium]|nr:hypothetical protein [Defluviitaleaceae bacterium]
MHALKGYFENGRFHPLTQPANVPERRVAVVTFLDDEIEVKPDTWDEFFELVSSFSEDEKPKFEDFPRLDLERELINFEEV